MNIEVTTEHLSKLLSSKLKIKDDKLCNLIVKNLEKSPVGMEQLCKALVFEDYPVCTLNVGDEVYVKEKDLHYWYHDKVAMKEQGFYYPGDKLKATIKSIDLYESDPICVEYFMIHKDTNKEMMNSTGVRLYEVTPLTDIDV
jgi:hypothetical protein